MVLHVFLYNSLYKQASWLPSYMRGHEDQAQPFWVRNTAGNVVGDYSFIKKALGYE